jgi:hypothetical protein
LIERSIVLAGHNTQCFESDSQVRELANMLGLHQAFGPAPSIGILPVVMPFKGMNPVSDDTWELCTDNPLWGNNAEASSSRQNILMIERAAYRPRLIRMIAKHTASAKQGSGGMIVPYDENFAVRHIMENLHPGSSS